MATQQELEQWINSGERNGIQLDEADIKSYKQLLVKQTALDMQRDDGGESAYLHRHDNIGKESNGPDWKVNRGEVKYFEIGERYFEASDDQMQRWFGSAEDSRIDYENKQKALEKAGVDLDDIPPDIMRMYGPELIQRIRDDRDFWDRHEEMKKGWRANAGISPDGKEMTGKAKRKKEKAERRAARESGVDFGIK